MFLLSKHLYMSTPQLQLCCGNGMILPLVTYQATTYTNGQTKDFVDIAIMDYFIQVFF